MINQLFNLVLVLCNLLMARYDVLIVFSRQNREFRLYIYMELIDQPLFLLIVTAFVSTLFASLLLSKYADSIGLLHSANDTHHRHSNATPLVGGLAIFSTLIVTALIFDIPAINSYTLSAMALLVLIGYIDDRRHISPAYRLLAQVYAASLLVAGNNTVVSDLGFLLGQDHLIELGNWAIPFTIFAIVGVINAFNMMDGINGLAATLTLIPILFISLLVPNQELSILGLTLAGAISAFLLFNMGIFSKQRIIFLGDAGSTLLGFVVAWMTIETVTQPHSPITPIGGLLLAAIPVVDAIAIMTRRKLSGRSPFLADKRHLHHIVMLFGKGPIYTLLAISSASVALAILAFEQKSLGLEDSTLFGVFIALFIVLHFIIRQASLKPAEAQEENLEPKPKPHEPMTNQSALNKM